MRAVIVIGTDEHRVNGDACEALAKIAAEHYLYQLGGKLFEVHADHARRVPLAYLRHLLSVAADWCRALKNGSRRCTFRRGAFAP